MGSEILLTRYEWEERMLEISGNLRNARRGILVALVGLLTCGCLMAASGPKQDGQTTEVKDGQVLMVAASIPHFPLLGTPGCPGQSSCQGFDVLEKQMLELLNLDRLNPANRAETSGHALPLQWDPKLAQIALAHSQGMAMRHYFSHVDPNGDSPVERFYKVGIQWRSMGENIAKNETVERAEAAFMNEPCFQPNHRGNILNPQFNRVGIGVVRGADGLLYVTQDFAEE